MRKERVRDRVTGRKNGGNHSSCSQTEMTSNHVPALRNIGLPINKENRSKMERKVFQGRSLKSQHGDK